MKIRRRADVGPMAAASAGLKPGFSPHRRRRSNSRYWRQGAASDSDRLAAEGPSARRGMGGGGARPKTLDRLALRGARWAASLFWIPWRRSSPAPGGDANSSVLRTNASRKKKTERKKTAPRRAPICVFIGTQRHIKACGPLGRFELQENRSAGARF